MGEVYCHEWMGAFNYNEKNKVIIIIVINLKKCVRRCVTL